MPSPSQRTEAHITTAGRVDRVQLAAHSACPTEFNHDRHRSFVNLFVASPKWSTGGRSWTVESSWPLGPWKVEVAADCYIVHHHHHRAAAVALQHKVRDKAAAQYYRHLSSPVITSKMWLLGLTPRRGAAAAAGAHYVMCVCA